MCCIKRYINYYIFTIFKLSLNCKERLSTASYIVSLANSYISLRTLPSSIKPLIQQSIQLKYYDMKKISLFIALILLFSFSLMVQSPSALAQYTNPNPNPTPNIDITTNPT